MTLYAVTIRYNPAGKNATKADYAKLLQDLNVTHVVYEHTAGLHCHGYLEWTGRYPRKTGYHIYCKKIADNNVQFWEWYLEKDKYKYPEFDIRKIAPSSQRCKAERRLSGEVNDPYQDQPPYPY